MRTPVGSPARRLAGSACQLWTILTIIVFACSQPAWAQDTTTRISVGPGGVEANGHSYYPVLSADGRFVAFFSEASNLVAGDTNAAVDVFVRDRLLGTTTRVSVSSDGSEGNGNSYDPAISADGRFVVFVSGATNLVTGDTNGATDVFVRDRLSGTTSRLSVGAGDVQGNGASAQPVVSADGRVVAFRSVASNLVTGDTNAAQDIFVRDLSSNTTVRVSVGPGGVQANDASSGLTLSADGRIVAFNSSATNLVAADGNGQGDVFVHDRGTGLTTRVSVGTGGVEAGGTSGGNLTLDRRGRYVGFSSDASNLVAGDTNGVNDVFVHDRLTGITTRVSLDADGIQAAARSLDPRLSATGRFVTFVSDAALVTDDTNGVPDVFLHDRLRGGTTRLSVGPAGAQCNSQCIGPAFSANGRFVAFISEASTLVADDTNLSFDVFVRELRLVPAPFDFFGAGRSDIAVWRPDTGVWFVKKSATEYAEWSSLRWGDSSLGDRPVPADYDGDGETDIAVWRGSTGEWFVKTSSSNFTQWFVRRWGLSTDRPLPGDFDGDGRADIVVWRPSTGVWYVLTSASGYGSFFEVRWGTEALNDVPVPGDYDGDGRLDIAVWRPSEGVWYVKRSSTSYTSWFSVQWGAPGDVPVPGDYDGDGKTDMVLWAPASGVWSVKESGTSFATSFSVRWGAGALGDVPAVADFDGDGRTDIAIWRPSDGTWYAKQSLNDYASWFSVRWGAGSLGDRPIGGVTR